MTTKKKEFFLHKVEIKGQDFTGEKVHTVPNQSMTLQEILKRFVRREQLPVMKDGVYETRFGDLEKLKNADITEQLDRADQLNDFIKRGKEHQDKMEKEMSEKMMREKLEKEEREKRPPGSTAPNEPEPPKA